MFNYRNIDKKSSYLKRDKKKNSRITLDAKHNEILVKFKLDNEEIPILLIKLKKKILKLDKTKNQDKKKTLLNKINKLKKKIINLKNKNNIVNYYLKTGNFLCSYYKNIQTNKNVKKNNKKILNNKNKFLMDKKINNENSFNKIIDFYNINNKPQLDKSFTNTKISSFITTNDKFNRTDYLNKYLVMIDKKYIPRIIYNTGINKCITCSMEMTVILSEGIQVCEKCGIQGKILVESNKPSFKDPPPEVSYFAYKRINHFNECLSQFQGKESTIVIQNVYDKLLMEIKKERIHNLAILTNKKIRDYLKKLKLHKFYEHIPKILYRLTGIPPPTLTKYTENKLRGMFREIQIPFREVCPDDRTNFISYDYVLHKLLQLLDLDEYAKYFKYLKDKTKLYKTDLIWKQICKKLRWEFIKSI